MKDGYVVIAGLATLAFCFFVVGWGSGRDDLRTQAVKNGNAVWVANDAGRTTFVWVNHKGTE